MIGMGIAAAGAIAQSVMGAVQASKAKKAIDNYRRQELTNIADGLSVSTLGADLAREEMARAAATSVNMLQQTGSRGAASVGQVTKAVGDQSLKIAANLDEQQKNIDAIRAKDELRIQTTMEARENADLAGLGQQQAVGQQNLFGGIAGAGTAIGQMDLTSIFGKAGAPTPKTTD
tara:strand:- start:18490 stop:19014 length:525 start_codon:yes stop_codon:yes gene_type:complete